MQSILTDVRGVSHAAHLGFTDFFVTAGGPSPRPAHPSDSSRTAVGEASTPCRSLQTCRFTSKIFGEMQNMNEYSKYADESTKSQRNSSPTAREKLLHVASAKDKIHTGSSCSRHRSSFNKFSRYKIFISDS